MFKFDATNISVFQIAALILLKGRSTIVIFMSQNSCCEYIDHIFLLLVKIIVKKLEHLLVLHVDSFQIGL